MARNKLERDRDNNSISLRDLASTFEDEPAYKSRGAIIMAGVFVKDLREEAGLSQSALAEKAGTTQARISIIENGTGYHGPSVDVLARIADACGKKLHMTAQP